MKWGKCHVRTTTWDIRLVMQNLSLLKEGTIKSEVERVGLRERALNAEGRDKVPV